MGMKYATRATLLMVALLFASCRAEEKKAPPAAEFYLVVDTSGSMVTGTMKKVKERLPSIMSAIHNGDKVHLIHFDEKAESVLDTVITTDADRAGVVSSIDSLQPRGRYTDLENLLDYLKQSVHPQAAGGPQYVIVLSDGIDDPRPTRNRRERRPKVDLKKYETGEKLAIQEPYIYYIHLGTTPGSDQAMNENLKDLGSGVTVVHPGEKTTDMGMGEVKKQIEASRMVPAEWYRKWWDMFMAIPLEIRLGIAGGAAVLLLLLLYLLIPKKKKPLVGYLNYWENAQHPSMARQIKLEKFLRKDLLIGSGRDSLIRIKDATFPPRLRLKAQGRGVNFHFGVAKKDLQRMVFLVQKKPGQISPGDTFKVNNYTFEYSHGSKK